MADIDTKEGLTVMAYIVSVLIDSVKVFRIGERANRNDKKMKDCKLSITPLETKPNRFQVHDMYIESRLQLNFSNNS